VKKQKDVWQGYPYNDRRGRAIESRNKSAQPGPRKQLDNLATKINEESKKKRALRAQIDEIKSVMSQCQASLAGSQR
jgi:hypothetical protein